MWVELLRLGPTAKLESALKVRFKSVSIVSYAADFLADSPKVGRLEIQVAKKYRIKSKARSPKEL